MSIEGNTSNPRAPAERNVYSKRKSAPLVFLSLKPQRGGMFIDGRHVYSIVGWVERLRAPRYQ